MNEMLRRQAATQATLDKYRDKPFSWEDNLTCIHMARYHVKKMGHRPERLPRIKSAISARRALDSRGWKDVGAMMDSLFPRIPYSQMLLGDILMFQSEDGFGALAIACGDMTARGPQVIGWHPDYEGLTKLIPIDIEGAWRV